jgi:hypothetical protein
MESREVFESTDNGKSWVKSPAATFSIRTAMGYQDQLLAISWHNGLLLQSSAGTAAMKEPTAGVSSNSAAKQQ